MDLPDPNEPQTAIELSEDNAQTPSMELETLNISEKLGSVEPPAPAKTTLGTVSYTHLTLPTKA